MKPQSAKAKGRKFQQWVRDRLLEAFPSLEKDDVKSTSMGAGGEDIQLSPAARKLFPYTIECKARKTLKGVYDIYDQACSHKDYEGLAFIKMDRRKPLVLVDADHYIKLISRKDDNSSSDR